MIISAIEVNELPASAPTGSLYAVVSAYGKPVYLQTSATPTSPVWVEVADTQKILDATRITDELVKIKYVGRTFETFVQEVQTWIAKSFPGNITDFSESTMGKVLIEIVAYLADAISWYIDKEVSEMYLSTAQRLDSVVRIARQLGYRAMGASAAVVEMKVGYAVANTTGADIIIPVGTLFSTAGGIIFESTEEGILPYTPGLNEVNFDGGVEDVDFIFIPAREGSTRTMIFTSDGTSYQRFKLSSLSSTKFVARNSVTVTINSVEWEEAAAIEFGDTTKFEAEYLAAVPFVAFGDGESGTIPEAGEQIVVTFVECSGYEGNSGVEKITSISPPLTTPSTGINLLQCINLERASGGNIPEDITRIKASAPRYFASQDRAVAEQDFVSLVEGYDSDIGNGSISKATAFTVRDESGVLFTLIADTQILVSSLIGASGEAAAIAEIGVNLDSLNEYLLGMVSDGCKANIVEIHCLSLDQTGEYVGPSQALLDEVELEVREKTMLPVDLLLVSGENDLVPVDITIEFQADRAYTSDAIRTSISGEIYDLIHAMDYGDPLRISDLYKAIENIDGVHYCHVVIVGADVDGDYIVDENQMITQGTITITALRRY